MADYVKHDETWWIPMCTPEKGKPWFWPQGVGDTKKGVRANFIKHCCVEWSQLRKEGWRIVRVRLTTELHQ
jgi:hypothetical protein